MSRRKPYILTWNNQQKQWRKFYRGTLYYCGSGRNKSDRDGYRAAATFWKQKKLEIDAGEVSTQKPKAFRDNLAGASTPPKETRQWNPKQVSSCLNQFIKSKQIDVDTGKITPSRLSDLTSRIQGFRDYFGKKLITQIDESDITDFNGHEATKVAEKLIKVSTLGQDYKAVRQFFNWCYKQRIISERPRNLDELAVTIPTRQNIYFTGDELNALVDACQKDSFAILKAAVLLGINMGFGQKDVSDLLVGEVLLNKRPPRIIRQRSKTDVPTNHLIWTSTRNCLLPFCADKKPTDRVFNRDDGRPLLPLSVKKGKVTGGRADFLGNKFKRLVQDVLGEDDTRRFRDLRRTGANFCKQRFPGTETMYLGHKDIRMSALYTEPAQKQFDIMLTYMEKDLGFTDKLMRLPNRTK